MLFTYSMQKYYRIFAHIPRIHPHTPIPPTPAQNGIFGTTKFVQRAPSFRPCITYVTAAGGMGEGEREGGGEKHGLGEATGAE